MLFLVPGSPYESYWRSLIEGRFAYGVLPTFASVILIVVVAWLWDRSNGSRDFVRSAGWVFFLAVGAILLFWLVMIFIANARNGLS